MQDRLRAEFLAVDDLEEVASWLGTFNRPAYSV